MQRMLRVLTQRSGALTHATPAQARARRHVRRGARGGAGARCRARCCAARQHAGCFRARCDSQPVQQR
jgi:hypothetical protein